MIIVLEKSGKILENSNADLEKADVLHCRLPMNLLLLISFQFMTKHLKFKVQKFEAILVVRIDECIV